MIRDDDGQSQRAVERLPASRHADLRRAAAARSGGSSARTINGPTAATARWSPAAACRTTSTRVELGLLRAQVREVAGLIYVSLADDPPDFDDAAEAIGPLARPQGLDRAKVAKIVDYDVAANWKIVWENNRECYHCNVNHPQYIKANFDHYNADDTSERIQSRIDEGRRPQRGKVVRRRAGREPSPHRHDAVPGRRSGTAGSPPIARRSSKATSARRWTAGRSRR